MNVEELLEIMDDKSIKSDLRKGACNAVRGLNLIAKYLPNSGITGAKTGLIYAEDIEKVLEAGLTKEDALILKRMDWVVLEEEGYFACFV